MVDPILCEVSSHNVCGDFIPKLHPEIRIQPFDSSYEVQRFLLSNKGQNLLINHRVKEILDLVDGTKNLRAICKALANSKPDKNITLEGTIAFFRQFVIENQLLVGSKKEENQSQQNEKSPFRLVKLFTIFGEKRTSQLASTLTFLFRPAAAYSFVMMAVMGKLSYYFLIMKPSYINPDIVFIESFPVFFAVVFASTILHELGHAAALRYYGQGDARIGFGIYFFIPVLFTDVTQVWQLKRLSRCVVNLGGVYFELIFGTMLLVLALVLKSKLILMAIFILDLKAICNLLPFFKMDGYWILVDALGIPNLRAEVLARLKYVFSRTIGADYSKPKSHYRRLTSWALDLYTLLSVAFYVYLSAVLLCSSKWLFKSLWKVAISSWQTHSIAMQPYQLISYGLRLLVLYFCCQVGISWLKSLWKGLFGKRKELL